MFLRDIMSLRIRMLSSLFVQEGALLLLKMNEIGLSNLPLATNQMKAMWKS